MTLLRKLALLLCLFAPFALPACASETPAEHAANVAAQQELDAAPLHGNLPDYSLPASQLAKAQRISHVRRIVQITMLVWSVVSVIILLWGGIAAWMRDRAMAASASLREAGKTGRAFWRECVIFTFLLSAITFALSLPILIYRHVLGLSYGLSVQGWGSWSADLAKSFVVELGGSILMYALLMWLVRRLPRTWWLAIWCVTVPLTFFFIFVKPVTYDLWFNKFQPLQQTNPELVAKLEKVVERGNMGIPPERMFLMNASAKVTTMNAYVTGFGASKRVVVWDTSLKNGTPDQVAFIFGHESGHYVLHHIMRGVTMGLVGLLLAMFLGYLFVNWSIRRFGGQWRIPAQTDWAAIVVLTFAFALLQLAGGPITGYFTRISEHAADVYGQEAIHGIVADPQASARDAFAALAATSLEEPNEPQWANTLFSDHPSTGRRAAFAAHYDPWAPGATPKYFSK